MEEYRTFLLCELEFLAVTVGDRLPDSPWALPEEWNVLASIFECETFCGTSVFWRFGYSLPYFIHPAASICLELGVLILYSHFFSLMSPAC
jgi:hypothetical protein